jgi:hypothetical protein
MMLKLWKDDCGALIATEWLFVATILVLGVITGLVGVRNFVNSGLQEFANAVGSLDQSYSFSGQVGVSFGGGSFGGSFGGSSGGFGGPYAFTAGSAAIDSVHTGAIFCTPPVGTAISSQPCG